MKNYVRELTEGMQRLCAVANRIVAQGGRVSPIETDLLMEDLRRLYDVALKMSGDALPSTNSEERMEPVSGDEHMMAMMATMAALSAEPTSQQSAEPTPQQSAEPTTQQTSEPVPQQSAEPTEVQPEVSTPSEPTEQPEMVENVDHEEIPVEPEPLPTMEELENNGNALLFDEVIIEPEEPEAAVHEEPVEIPQEEPVEVMPEESVAEQTEVPQEEPVAPPQGAEGQVSLLDYLKQPVSRTLGESLATSHPLQESLNKKVDDLRTVININDKFSFMSELFHNNMKAYNDFIMHLNATAGRDEAMAHVRDIAAQYKWNDESPVVAAFYKIFDKKF